MKDTVRFTIMPSPVGRLTLTSTRDALSGVIFENHEAAEQGSDWKRDDGALAAARRQLEEYFAGKRSAFDLSLAMEGTPFQRRVWTALTEIPFGKTVAYSDIARRIGKPSASRAVGAANGRNPIAIVVPCHRVIGADGSLTGYGGGEARKKFLLELETPTLLSARRRAS
jgi:methylated-DNA-[protein]-cysteine S-methyltransferase